MAFPPEKDKSKWQIDSREIIHENPWYKYVHDKGKTNKGHDYEYYFLQINYSVGIIGLAEGKLILVRQYRYLTNRDSLEVPGGGGKRDSDPEETAKREFIEETGYDAGHLEKIGEFDVANGYSSDIAHVFLAKNCIKAGKQKLDPSEDGMKVELYPVEKVYEMVQDGKITDSFALAALMLAWPYLL